MVHECATCLVSVRRRGSPTSSGMAQVQGISGQPNEAALLSLMERTGYAMIQENGQRKYGGPPPGEMQIFIFSVTLDRSFQDLWI